MAKYFWYTPLWSVNEMDDYIIKNWKLFSNSNQGYSSCVTNHKYGFSQNKKANVLHNCVGWAWGRFYGIRGQESKFPRDNGNPYELYWKVKRGSRIFEHGGVGDTPKLGAMVIWGRPEDASGASRSHIGIVEWIDWDKGIMYVSEDNYSTLRKKPWYEVNSRNGVHAYPINGALSSSYPLVGYIYQPKECRWGWTYNTTVNLRLRASARTGTIFTVMPKGSKIAFYGEQTWDNDNDIWYRVNYNGTWGWCSAEYLKEC